MTSLNIEIFDMVRNLRKRLYPKSLGVYRFSTSRLETSTLFGSILKRLHRHD